MSVNTGCDDLKQKEEAWPLIYEFEEPDVYDDLGAPAEVCRCTIPLKYSMKDINHCTVFQSHICSLADFTFSLLYSGLNVQNSKQFVLLSV